MGVRRLIRVLFNIGLITRKSTGRRSPHTVMSGRNHIIFRTKQTRLGGVVPVNTTHGACVCKSYEARRLHDDSGTPNVRRRD